ncbi:hypothetical protein ACFQY0_15325 [Haloferula chungangensis]|uniref:Organic solvent tolerance-like N-terminal domain-containing protein n=1 Tax=Haloferula chungangensis TaxID=1048331 RepID=A0ABW2LBL2_9BACT
MIPSFPAPSIPLRPWLVALSLGLVTSLGAQILNPLNPLDNLEDEVEDEGFPAMKMLIEGSILQGVTVPQYDAEHRLSSVMRAAKLTMVNEDLINAETLRIDFYNPDRTPKGRIELETATVEDQKTLRSSDPVSLVSDELNLKGTGLVYELNKSRGFLYGPAHATTLIDTRTSMKSTPTQRSVIAGAMIAATASASAEGLDKLDDQQLKGLDHLAASKKSEAEAAVKEADASLEKSTRQSGEADESLGKFLRDAAIDVPSGAIPDLQSKVPDPEELEAQQLASFSADDGIFFDSEAGLLVFLKNVKATHPEFTLVGADEVKVFLEKVESKESSTAGPEPGARKIDPKEAGDLLGGAKFGDPSKIIATGTIVVEKIKTKPGDKSAKASGRQIVFDFKTNEVILRGGEPWIISETISGRVVDPNGYIRVNVETGDGSFVGDSEGFVAFDKPKKK